MSQITGWTRLANFPTFELRYDVDNADDPAEVTVFEPTADDISTRWISIDADHAIPLERIA